MQLLRLCADNDFLVVPSAPFPSNHALAAEHLPLRRLVDHGRLRGAVCGKVVTGAVRGQCSGMVECESAALPRTTGMSWLCLPSYEVITVRRP